MGNDAQIAGPPADEGAPFFHNPGKRSPSLMFSTGILLGMLPCRLSFASFSRALALGGPGEGGLLLLAFGRSTVPGLLLIGTGASALARR
ncbi:MAG: sulfite exporter TauE/SafE family protein [Syntrophobacteria bacterium]